MGGGGGGGGDRRMRGSSIYYFNVCVCVCVMEVGCSWGGTRLVTQGPSYFNWGAAVEADANREQQLKHGEGLYDCKCRHELDPISHKNLYYGEFNTRHYTYRIFKFASLSCFLWLVKS